jgi:preprotein translocase subunit SecY
MKQTGIYLILGGAVVFILVFIGKIMALVFNNPLLGLALMAVVIGVFILLYSIIQEERVAKKNESFRGLDK